MHCIKSLLVCARQQTKVGTGTIQHVLNNIYYTIKRPQYCFAHSIVEVEDESEKIINELCNGDPELEKKLRILMLEVEVMRQDGQCAPNSLKTFHWKHLMQLPSKNQKNSYLLYLFKTEKSRENKKAKKEARRKEFETKPEEIKEYPDDLSYGLSHQSLFLRIRDQCINRFDNYRLLQAMMHGQSIVIDCSYEEHMVWKECLNAAKQLTLLFGDNRLHNNPFNLHMCNVNFDGDFMQQLRKNIPLIEDPWFPINMHTESYIDIFPKEKLVYLTPHCRNELTEFDYNAVYIIGCMVDKVNNDPLSLAKAKRDGIKMAKLPLDRYLEWAPGAKKNLNINHMIPILLDLKATQDWEYSLRHIPRRKLMQTKILAMQNKFKNKKLFKDDIFKTFNKQSTFNKMLFKEKRNKAKQSLYVDDEKI